MFSRTISKCDRTKIQRATRDEREDLTPLEKEAVTLYLEYSSEVQKYLMHPGEISGQEEWSWFQAVVRHLDDAIARSTLQPGDLVFRGMRSDFTKRLLFLLSIDAGECSEDGFHRVTPHVIRDQGYSSFTRNARQFFQEKGIPGYYWSTRRTLPTGLSKSEAKTLNYCTPGHSCG